VDLVSRKPEIKAMVLQSPLESGARAVFGKAVSWVGYYMDIFKNYEKLLALQGRRDAEREQNETTQEKRIAEEPCVGICQYYRSLGIENPYDRNIKRNF